MKVNRFTLIEVDELLQKISQHSNNPNLVSKFSLEALDILADIFDEEEEKE